MRNNEESKSLVSKLDKRKGPIAFKKVKYPKAETKNKMCYKVFYKFSVDYESWHWFLCSSNSTEIARSALGHEKLENCKRAWKRFWKNCCSTIIYKECIW